MKTYTIHVTEYRTAVYTVRAENDKDALNRFLYEGEYQGDLDCFDAREETAVIVEEYE